jgi:hypothetical protein
MKSAVVTLVLAAALAGTSAAALADSAPIGPLPTGPVASIQAQHGELVAVALPNRSGGRVWRLARPLDARILRQVGEANVGSSVVLVFRARTSGATTIAVALTRSDTSSVALESRRFDIRVR